MLEALIVSSLEKVGLGREPAPFQGSMEAFRGETVSFQIAFRGGCTEGGKKAAVNWEVRKETDPGTGQSPEDGEGTTAPHATGGERKPEGVRVPGLPETPEVRVRRVLSVMCRCSCNPEETDDDYLFKDARTAPDLLRELEGDTVPLTQEWQSLWVDICPRKKQEPGRYAITFCLAEEGGSAAECRMEIRVIGDELPPLPILHTEWFHCDGIVDYYGVEAFSGEFWRIFRNFVRVYVKRGGNMMYVPVLTPPLDTEVGLERTTIQLVRVERKEAEYRFDFTDLEQFLEICRSEGIDHFEICHLFTQWGATAAPKVVAWENGECRRIFGWETSSDDPEYLGFLGALIPALKEFLDRRGILKNTYFHISDEPNLTSVQYKTAQGAVRELLKGCTIIEAVSDYEYYGKGLVDIPVCATNHIEPFLENRPPVLWSYYCCGQTVDVPNRFISMPSWRNRIYGILLYWLKMDGFLHWGFNFYNSILSRKKINPYETVDADGGFPAGDPFLVYPGENGIPEESIRLMVQDEAINDYRALCALESRIGRDKVMDLIRQEAGMELSFRQYPKGDEFILSLREKVNALVAEGA